MDKTKAYSFYNSCGDRVSIQLEVSTASGYKDMELEKEFFTCGETVLFFKMEDGQQIRIALKES